MATLSEPCRSLLNLIKELQIDGRPAVYDGPSPLSGHEPRKRFDPVPEFLLYVETWERPAGSPLDRTGDLVELRTRGLIRRIRLDKISFGTYRRPDGQTVSVRERRWRTNTGFEVRLGKMWILSAQFPDVGWAYTLEPGWAEVLAGESLADELGDFQSPGFFAKRSIYGSSLRGAAENGRIRRRRVSPGRYTYSTHDARKLWPDKFTAETAPQDRRQTT